MRRNGRERPEAGRLPRPSIRSALAISTSVQPFSDSRRTNPIRIDLPVAAVLSAGARPPAVAIATCPWSPQGCSPAAAAVKYRRFTGRRCGANTGKAIEIAKENGRAPNRRITGAETGRTGELTGRALLFRVGASPSFRSPTSPTIGKCGQRPLPRSRALAKQSAPEAVELRTRKCHSALTAMRRSRQKCKRDSIYPHCSRVRRSWPWRLRRRRRAAGGSTAPRPSASGLPDPSANGKVGPHRWRVTQRRAANGEDYA